MQWQRPQDCWALLYSKIEATVSENIKEDWEKTIQKICEMLLRNLIENSKKEQQLALIQEILNHGVKNLNNRPNDIFFNKLIDFSFKHKQVALAELLYDFMTKTLSINPTIVTINTLIDQYFKNDQA